MAGVVSGEEVEEDLAVVMVGNTQGLHHHTQDILPIAVRPRREKAGDRASGLGRWAVLQLVTRWGEEARGMVRPLQAGDTMTTVTPGKAVHGLVQRRGSQLLLQAPGSDQPGEGEGVNKNFLSPFRLADYLVIHLPFRKA